MSKVGKGCLKLGNRKLYCRLWYVQRFGNYRSDATGEETRSNLMDSETGSIFRCEEIGSNFRGQETEIFSEIEFTVPFITYEY